MDSDIVKYFDIAQADFIFEWKVYIQKKKKMICTVGLEINNVELCKQSIWLTWQTVETFLTCSDWHCCCACHGWWTNFLTCVLTGIVTVPAMGWWTGDPGEVPDLSLQSKNMQVTNTVCRLGKSWMKVQFSKWREVTLSCAPCQELGTEEHTAGVVMTC